ncbi:MAG TPA: 50S ribosomal protein L6 [Candidatus Hypogeohydataceae bacterium YC41]
MSRIGRLLIAIPKTVELKIEEGTLKVKGPLGELLQKFHPSVKFEFDQSSRLLQVNVAEEEPKREALWGLSRTLAFNAVEGVVKGFSKEMEIHGLGYSAKVQGKDLVLSVGYMNPVHLTIPQGIKVEITQPTNPARFIIKGVDKQLVGQFAATVRSVRKVEPYKGKGIRYKDEVIRKKAGKAFAGGAT